MADAAVRGSNLRRGVLPPVAALVYDRGGIHLINRHSARRWTRLRALSGSHAPQP
jgi:hypothetical protein